MSDSIREQIIQAAEEQLKTMATANGYNTDLGSSVFRAKNRVHEKELPVISILDGEEHVERKHGALAVTMALTVEVLIDAQDHDSSPLANQILADILTCILSDNTPFHPLIDSVEYTSGSISYPEDISTIVGVSAVFTFTYSIINNNPYAQP